ncbi:DUF3142 domain-containing protein [Pseudomonas sp. ML96]|uniref:DUF3142 domain-containing protein n=1 Tax=Pseudomonas sp. ML96 TaxID=1523503 RepID=UPI000A6C3E19|nr:DUF3142 domain-containing protein [Pseudomonas sp. ML96]
MLHSLYRTLIVLLLAGLAGCSEENTPLDQQLYIWQRQWLPSHAEALTRSRADFSTLRVLALQAHPQAGWSRALVDAELLKRDGRPLIAVVRLDGQLPQLDRAEITRQIDRLLADWRAAGLNPRGLEIDHDCASARLPAYAELLRELRRQLPTELQLSITALPAWLSSPALDQVLATVDSSVLQVHAVNAPQDGLFDPEQAQDWTERYAQRSGKPFLLALPAYGVALTENGQVESEVPLRQGGPRRELRADPEQVGELLGELRASPPNQLAGIIWFRLPLSGDRRAWPMPTLLAVARGQPLAPAIALQRQQRDGFSQLQLFNNGTLASQLPRRIELPARACSAADGLGDYRVERSDDLLAFVRRSNGRLDAGEHRALGWARCAQIDQGGMHVVF